MKRIVLLFAASVIPACLLTSCAAPTYSVGVGYKVQELELTYNKERINHPVTARLKMYWEYEEKLVYGVEHHSQWLTGQPFNDKKEYSKTEVFIDWKFKL